MPSRQWQSTAPGITGDDVIEIIGVCGVRRRASWLEHAQTKVVIDAAVGEENGMAQAGPPEVGAKVYERSTAGRSRGKAALAATASATCTSSWTTP